MATLTTTVTNDTLHIGPHMQISLQRTLRIPDDGGAYPLPPSLGRFPIAKVSDYLDRVPEAWREHGGVFLPMYQREAMWLSFSGSHAWHPTALKVGIGKINALTGKPWNERLHNSKNTPQDYLVAPNQPWLDGINAGSERIKQFIAMPLGMGYTVEGQVTGEEIFGGIQLMAFDAKSGRFPDTMPAINSIPRPFGTHPSCYPNMIPSPFYGTVMGGAESYTSSTQVDYLASNDPSTGTKRRRSSLLASTHTETRNAPGGGASEMGLGAGGTMEQKIYQDEHGLDTWNSKASGRVYVHIINSAMYEEITGKRPPQTPVDAHSYTQYGYPWFSIYDEHKADIAPSKTLKTVKTVKEMDDQHGFGSQQNDTSVEIDPAHIKPGLPVHPAQVIDGNW